MAFRMLGSLGEAEDAVQEAWVRVSRADVGGVVNADAWMTTVLVNVCLDLLRARRGHAEEPVDPAVIEARGAAQIDPEEEAVLAESVGLALLVVLDRLAPAERVALVLHDAFEVPFGEIARMLGRTPESARQLASRARRRVRGGGSAAPAAVARQREVVTAFMAAARQGDFERLLSLLAPDVGLRADERAARGMRARELAGAATVARSASAFSSGARFATVALVDGAPGVVLVRRGRLLVALRVQTVRDRIAAIDVVADPERLRALSLALL